MAQTQSGRTSQGILTSSNGIASIASDRSPVLAVKSLNRLSEAVSQQQKLKVQAQGEQQMASQSA